MIHAGINYGQTRLSRSVMVVEGDAGRWDRVLSTNCLITDDGMAMVRPRQKTPAWYTTTGTTSSDYARFGLASLTNEAGTTLAIAGGYIVNDLRLAGDSFVENLGGTNARVYTQTSWSANQGFWMEMWVPASKASERAAIDFAWGEAGAVGSVGVRIYVGGEIEVYKWFSVGGTPTERMVGRYDGRGEGRSARVNSNAGQLFSAMLLPCSRRDLYIATSTGATVRHTFTDLSPDEVNTITPAGRAWFYVPTGKFSVSLSELRFPIGGPVNLWTEIDHLRETPTGVVSWASTIYADKALPSDTLTGVTAQVVHPDNVTTPYPSAGGPDRARILLQLTAGARYTPFVYAAYSRRAPATTTLQHNVTILSGNSSGGSIDTTDDILQSLDMTVGEGPDGVKGSMRLKDKTDLAILRQSNHSLRLLVSQPKLVDSFADYRNLMLGITGAPKRVESQREIAGGFRECTMPFSDMWAFLESSVFEENSYPYDGWLLHQAVGDLLTLAGIPLTPRDIQTTTVRLDYVRPTNDTPWAWKPQAGDSVAMWLKKIYEAYCPTWFMGFYPTATVVPSGGTTTTVGTWGFQLRSPSTMSTTPTAIVWMSAEGDAINTYEPSAGEKIPCFSFTEETLPAEATRITIWGYDPASKTMLRGNWSNTSLEDATLNPAVRPAGWVGFVAPYVAILPKLRTASSVAAARDAVVSQLGVEVKAAEWTSPILFNSSTGVVLWKGDVVEIRPATTTLPGGNPVGGKYRILSFSLSWKRDALGRRLVSYTGERIGDVRAIEDTPGFEPVEGPG